MASPAHGPILVDLCSCLRMDGADGNTWLTGPGGKPKTRAPLAKDVPETAPSGCMLFHGLPPTGGSPLERSKGPVICAKLWGKLVVDWKGS